MSNRPTPEELKDAREWFDEEELAQLSAEYGSISTKHIRVLLAATEPPSDADLFVSAEDAWCAAAAENQHEFVEGYFAGIRSLLGPVKP